MENNLIKNSMSAKHVFLSLGIRPQADYVSMYYCSVLVHIPASLSSHVYVRERGGVAMVVLTHP